MAMFDAVVVCARFQPPHRSHFEAIEHGLSEAERVVVLCFGADESRSLVNPWSNDAREALIRAGLTDASRVDVAFLEDVQYDHAAWSRRAETCVAEFVDAAARIGVVADQTPGRDHMPIPAGWHLIERDCAFAHDERTLREHLLWRNGEVRWQDIERAVPQEVAAQLRQFTGEPGYARLRDEAAFIKSFKARWSTAPYPPVFVTVDALVSWSEEVLLIRRGHAPGAGLWALPGGFIDPGETLASACLRELHEETGLVLGAGAVTERRVFDAPERSVRGRTVTHVFRFDLDPAAPRPAVHGGDDAAAAAWVERDALRPAAMFEDHYAILQVMLGLF